MLEGGWGEDDGAAGSVGRAEEADGEAEGVLEGGVAGGELLAEAGGGLPGEPGVGHRMVADEVAGGGDGAGDLGALADVAADEEERRSDLVAGEDFEEALGGDVVGAIVVGEGDLVGVAARDEGGPEELGLWGEGGGGPGASGGGGCGEDGGDCLGLRHLLLPPHPPPPGYIGLPSYFDSM